MTPGLTVCAVNLLQATLRAAALQPANQETADTIEIVHQALKVCGDVDVTTEHLLHAGMYIRTIRFKAGTVSVGSRIKRSTLLIVNGSCSVLTNDGWLHFEGYNVIPGFAGRKMLRACHTDCELTMIFPTQATTVEEAEAEVFAEADILLSRRDGTRDTTTITGE